MEAVVATKEPPAKETRKVRWMELSEPKKSKSIWWTSFEPNYLWGNQEPLWPISKRALSAVPSTRVEELSQPKIDYSIPRTIIPMFEYGCGRPSQIWTTSPPAMCCARPSRRLHELARHKSAPPRFTAQHVPHYEYGCGRTSTIWKLTSKTMTCPPRPYTFRLAEAKGYHPLYEPARGSQSIVTHGAKSYSITPNMETLAKPKYRGDGPFRDAQWEVPATAKQAIPSERTVELARARKPAEGYVPNRAPLWRVGMGAMNAVASNRMEEISKPIIRDTMDSVQFNPDVFNVSEAAKKAKASARIEELAEPIKRGK